MPPVDQPRQSIPEIAVSYKSRPGPAKDSNAVDSSFKALRKEQESRKRKDRLPVSVRHGLRQLRKEQAGTLGVLRKELERVSVRTAPL